MWCCSWPCGERSVRTEEIYVRVDTTITRLADVKNGLERQETDRDETSAFSHLPVPLSAAHVSLELAAVGVSHAAPALEPVRCPRTYENAEMQKMQKMRSEKFAD